MIARIGLLSWLAVVSLGPLGVAGSERGQSAGFLHNGVTAHRGNSGEVPENTLAAFRSAMQLGADWIELDVYRSRDGKLVVSHDKKTGRVGDKDLVVAESSYAELQAVDVATLFRKQRGLSVQACAPQRMPLLDDVLKLVMGQRKTRMSIQPKMDCVAEIVALVDKLGARPWVGFNDGKLAYMSEVKRLAPEVPVFWDRYRSDVDREISTALTERFESMVLHRSTVTNERVAAIKQAGMEAGVWTVNDRETMRRLLNLGVERIYTDFPATLLALKAGGPRQGRTCEAAKSAKGRKTVRLLTIGNSFSRNATHWLGDLVHAAGHELIHHDAWFGGASLAQHWDRAVRFEKDPNDKKATYGTGRSLKQELLAEKWDFVTIQQYSLISHDPTTYWPCARRLRDYAAKHAPQAEVLVHQTWAYRCDDPRFTKPPTKPGEPTSQKAMYAGLTKAYEGIADELGLRVIPVGDALFSADTNPTWGYVPDRKFDPSKVKYPSLPEQRHSLHVGWRWTKDRSGKPLLRMDGHHANLAGEYLGACVFFEMLFNESVVDVAWAPPQLDAVYARFLRETAHRAVQGRCAVD
jgi:glycerophosphoryl diester phosphodiesterase